MPVLIQLGPFPLYSFGLFLTLAVLLGTFASWRKARESHYEDDKFFDLVFSGMLGAIILGRAWFVVENYADFGFNLIKWLWFTHFVGISFMGALLGALVAVIIVARHYSLDTYQILDLLGIGGALGLALSWIGAFLDGFPVGMQVESLGLVMPGLEGRYFPVHLVAVLGFFGLYLLLNYFEPRWRTFEWYRAGRSSAKSGFMFGVFLIGMGLLHMITSRLVLSPQLVAGLPLESWLGLLVALGGGILIYSRSGRKLKADLISLTQRRKSR